MMRSKKEKRTSLFSLDCNCCLLVIILPRLCSSFLSRWEKYIYSPPLVTFIELAYNAIIIIRRRRRMDRDDGGENEEETREGCRISWSMQLPFFACMWLICVHVSFSRLERARRCILSQTSSMSVAIEIPSSPPHRPLSLQNLLVKTLHGLIRYQRIEPNVHSPATTSPDYMESLDARAGHKILIKKGSRAIVMRLNSRPFGWSVSPRAILILRRYNMST